MRPKTIYFYEYKKLVRHKVTSYCLVEIVKQEFDGPRLRCRCYREGLAGAISVAIHTHDIYGYDNLKQAKALEIKETRSRLYDEQKWLEKLGGG